MTGLRVRDLTVVYHTDEGPVAAVDGSSFDIAPGERLGIVGESGSGKTTTALALIQMLRPPGRVEGGSAVIDGVDLLKLGPAEMRRHRLRTLSYVPQGAMSSLNPVMTIARQFRNALVDHDVRLGQRELELRIRQALAGVELDRRVAGLYPHELSGGMKQRVCIAMAITLRPRIIIADEPTSALDVVTQRQVMETLASAQEMLGASVILVGHDMGLMAQFVDRIGVMYAGRLVEVAPVAELFEEPLHPYSRLLISTLPSLETKGAFKGIPGIAPSLRRPPPGCHFHPRCPRVMPVCSSTKPDLVEIRPGRWVACHLY